MEDSPVDKTWSELNSLVLALKIKPKFIGIWSLIESKPLTTDSIDMLVREGWVVKEDCFASRCFYDIKKICIEKNIDNYERDKALFHELVHAWYPNELDDGFIAYYRLEHNAIAEWLARQLRANYQLLRHTVHSFNLKSHIYDKSSYLAFREDDLERQLVLFPFLQDYVEGLKSKVKKTLMN